MVSPQVLQEQNQLLLKENNQLKQALASAKNSTQPRIISDEQAELELRKFIATFKDEKKTYIGALDIYFELHIPAKQTDRIMKKLVNEGVVGDD